ncbi:hypothetical protein DV737_g702, partial [Chaetothyriales sp. CBS 132003]
MATSDLDQLIDMGFEREKAGMAVKKTGSLAAAIDWLDQNSEKTCGKRFRGTAEAEFHASKTEHQDFSESTEELAPLTEEEKKAKLAGLREKLAAKRAATSEQDKIDKKRNEEISRKKTKESQDIKEQLKVKEQIKDAEKKRREKREEIEAKKKIQAQIAADKEERRLRAERDKAQRAGAAAPPQPTAAPLPAVPSKPASEYTETRLRLQTSQGNIIKTFPADTTLFEVAAIVKQAVGHEIESFTQNFPKKIFDQEYFGETLKELKLTKEMTTTRAAQTQATTKLSGIAREVAKPLPDDNFLWTYTEEPHRTRRQEIIKAHKDVLGLCGPEPLTKYLVLAVVSVQIACAIALKNTPPKSWSFWLTAYLVGATANQNLFLAIHEISHNLAFKSPLYNRAFAILANLPIGLPYSAGFRQYHLTHHKSLGVDGLDTDLPTALEAIFFDSVFGKAFFCTFQLLFYAVRPMFIYRVPFGIIHYCNIVAQLVFDLIIVKFLGWNAMVYLLLSSFLAGSLHPCAGHFISEHYVFARSSIKEAKMPRDIPIPETFSYYGPLNILTYNVGYHNEHHDFPAIPWTRLPKLHELANEFYQPLPCHRSWSLVIWQFIVDKEVGMWPGPEFSFEGALGKLAYFAPALPDMSTRFLTPGDSTTHRQDLERDEFGFSDREGRLLQVSSQLDFDSKTSIGCVGALINYLQRKRTSGYLREDQEAQLAYRILRIEMLSLRNTINPTRIAPQYVQSRSRTSGSKDGLSVFGLFQRHAQTPQGKAQLRTIFLRPSIDVNAINERLDFVSTLVRPSNIEVVNRLSKNLTKIKNMRNIIALPHKGVVGRSHKQGSFKSGVWSSLLESCYHTIDLAGAIQDILGGEHLPLCARVSKALTGFELQRICRMIHDVIDVELSVEQHRTVIKRGIDQQLDQIKDHYDGISNLLTQIADEIIQTMPSDVNCSLNVVFFPQFGFHITVPRKKNTNEALWSGADWEQTFSTANQVYFKNVQMRQIDHDQGGLWGNISDIEIELTYDLAQSVLESEEMLIEASDACGELDSLLAFVHGAIEHKLTRPRLVEENIIDIKAGRHLLQEMTVPLYVPNDTRLAGGDATMNDESRMPNMLVLTGPNYSGKSVYQKQVGLVAYMAQIGSFVAAEACTIAITDKIPTNIATTETVSKAQSTFTIDLQQIALALNLCTSRSLVLIDKFGRGTDSCDGAGLAAEVFCHLLDRGPETPKVLVASHFHEVFETGFFDDHPKLSHGHMTVYIDEASTPDQDRSTLHADMTEVTYLYTLQGGRRGSGDGVRSAARAGYSAATKGRDISQGIHGT